MFSSNNSQVSNDAVFVEDIFSTYLYTGNGSTQTITNGIDLSTKGGLVWIKSRSSVNPSTLFDTARGATKYLFTTSTAAQGTAANTLTSFNTTGFSLGTDATIGTVNTSGDTYASWTFRKQPKFFDVVTYTGTGSATTIAHNLGSVPACIMVKRTDTTGAWQVYHRSLANTEYLVLNTTAAKATGTTRWNSTTPTSTVFSIGTDATVNASGGTYVAYLFAHDAGGFGLTGTDNVISCGSFTTNGSGNATVTLGYEPQFVLYKASSAAEDWNIVDVTRGFNQTSLSRLKPNVADAETTASGNYFFPTATGFTSASGWLTASTTYIYIAIRRGPMKVPTSGTSVFSAQTGTYSAGDSLSVDFPADMYIDAWRTGTLYKANYSRLVNFANSNSSASQNYLKTNTTDAEVTTSQAPSLYDLWNTTAKVGSWNAGVSEVWWMFRRAPSFFDEVCYTGTGAGDNPRTFTHNLQVVPELMLIKRRNSTAPWIVYSASQGASKYANLNTTDAFSTADEYLFNNTSPTASVFTVGSPNGASSYVNASGGTYVNYLFATCAGVSKVGSYTGTGTTKQIDCGFTGGARFVLIKRTDSTGDWYVWDSARGIVSGNDPYLLLNSTAAEVTNTDYIDTYSAGFEISSTAPAAINANGGTFIFLAIA